MISLAFASGAAAQPSGADIALQFLPMIGIFVVFYFMMIRPQMKKAREHQSMVSSLQKGDEVITNSGLMGRIVKISETAIALEVADSVVLDFQKNAIQALLPKGTLRDLYKAPVKTEPANDSQVKLDK